MRCSTGVCAVDDDFDPYRKWLGIPPEEQPPDHYRLLGIPRFEEDPDVIESAADRQMAHLRTFQTGKRSALSQEILNQLSAAKVCLLDRNRRQQYDDELRGALRLRGASTAGGALPRPGLAATAPSASAPTRPMPSAGQAPAPVAVASVPVARTRPMDREVVSVPGPVRVRRKSSPAPIIGAVAAIGFLGLLVLIIIQVLADPGEQEAKNPSHRPAKKPKAAAPVKTSAKGDTETRPPTPRTETPKAKPPSSTPIVKPTPTPPNDDDTPSPMLPTTDPSDDKPDKPDKPAMDETVAKKAAPPSKTALERAVRKVKEEYRPSLAGAKTRDDRIALAHEMIAQAEDSKVEPVVQYATLLVAREIAVILAHSETFCEAIDAIGERFAIDVLEEKRLALEEAAKEAHRPEQFRDLIDLAEELTRGALVSEKFEKADASARTARALAKKLTDPKDKVETVPRIEALVTEVGDREKEFKNYRKSTKQLAAEPDDPAANLAVGRYLCVVKRDWPIGLKHLTKTAADSKYKELAEKDLAEPKEPAPQIELADGWMALGKRQGGVYKTAFYERAKFWLDKASQKLPDGEKEKVRPKLEEIEEWAATGS
jgi:cytoskeletal protein RodZ